MHFWNPSTIELEEFRPGITSKAVTGNQLIMVCMRIEQGREDLGHEHPFDQCGMVVEGRIEMFAGEKRHILTRNECYFIAAGERHGWKTLDEPVTLLDISSRPGA